MESTKNLFSIVLNSDYYKNNILSDIKIYPDFTTKNLFKRYSLNFIEKNGSYDLIWLTKNIKNTDICVKNLFQDVHFKFFLKIENLLVFNFLKIQHNKVYNFENNEHNNFLHKNEYVTDDDFSNCKDYANKIFGFISINMNILLQEDNFLNIEKRYNINLPTIESFWEIKIIDDKNQIKKIDNFFINDQKYIFNQTKKNVERSFFSKYPIKLGEIGINSFAFSYITNSDEKKLIHLPSPIFYDKISEKGEYISIVKVNI